MTAELINAACNPDLVINGNKLVKWHEHVLILLSIKNAQRIEIWYNMTRQEYFLAKKGIFYPYKPATEDDIAAGADDVQDDLGVPYR